MHLYGMFDILGLRVLVIRCDMQSVIVLIVMRLLVFFRNSAKDLQFCAATK